MSNIAERYKEWKKKQSDNDRSERYRSWNAKNVARDIYRRTNSWLTSTGDFIKGYNERYGGDNSSWRGDASDYYNNALKSTSEFDTEADAILDLMSRYGEYFDDDFKKSIGDALSGNRESYGSALKGAESDRDYWGQWDSQEEYEYAKYATQLDDLMGQINSIHQNNPHGLDQLEQSEVNRLTSEMENISNTMMGDRYAKYNAHYRYNKNAKTIAELEKVLADEYGGPIKSTAKSAAEEFVALIKGENLDTRYDKLKSQLNELKAENDSLLEYVDPERYEEYKNLNWAQKALNTGLNVAQNIHYGALKSIEDVVDFVNTAGTAGAKALSDVGIELGTRSGLMDEATVSAHRYRADQKEKERIENINYDWVNDNLLLGGKQHDYYYDKNLLSGNTAANDLVTETAQGVGRLLPHVALSVASGGVGSALSNAGYTNAAANLAKTVPQISKAAFALSAAGAGANEAFEQGASSTQAFGYGAASGALETATEYLGGMVFGESVDLGSTAVGRFLQKHGLDKYVTQGLGKYAYTFASEGSEEVLADLASPVIKAAFDIGDSRDKYFGSNWKQGWAEIRKGLFKTFAVGGLVGITMQGLQSGVSALANLDKGGARYNAISEQMEIIENSMKANEILQASNEMSEHQKFAASEQLNKTFKDSIEKISNSMKRLTTEQRNTVFEEAPILAAFIDENGEIAADLESPDVFNPSRIDSAVDSLKDEGVRESVKALVQGEIVSDKKINAVLANNKAREILSLRTGVKIDKNTTVREVKEAITEAANDHTRGKTALVLAASLDMGANGARAVARIVENGSGDVSHIVQAFNAVYQAGKQGKTISEAKNPHLSELSFAEKKAAYEYGVMDAMVDKTKSEAGPVEVGAGMPANEAAMPMSSPIGVGATEGAGTLPSTATVPTSAATVSNKESVSSKEAATDKTDNVEKKEAKAEKKEAKREKQELSGESKTLSSGEVVTPVKSLNKEQTRVVEGGKKFGVEVIIADIKSETGENVDAMFDGKRLYINPDPNSGSPAFQLLKHEMTHFPERRTPLSFSTFVTEVTDSKAFKEWLKENGYKNSEAYVNEIIENYKIAGKDYSSEKGRPKAQAEMVANFVADKLFGDEKGFDRFVDGLSQNQRKSLGDYVRSFIDWVREKLGKMSEIELLEKRYSKLVGKSLQGFSSGTDSKSVNGKESQYAYTPKNDVDNYTEEQYNDFGWVRANNVINAGYWRNFTENFARAVTGNGHYPKTQKGEYMIDVYDAYDNSGTTDVIVFANGTIENPNVTKIVKIDSNNSTDIEYERREILEAERRGIQQKAGEFFRFYNKADFIGKRWQQGVSANENRDSSRLNTKRSASEIKANPIVEFRVNEDKGTVTTIHRNGEVEETSYSYTPSERDAEYLDAVNNGDTKAAQRMVDEAAKEAGYDYHLYHGTDADFTVFDLRKYGGQNGKGEGYGIYLAANREVSAPYGKNVIDSYTKFNRLAEGSKKTLSYAEVKKIVKKSCELDAQRAVEDGEYDSVDEAIRDTWVSNVVYTYDYSSMSQVYADVADQLWEQNDNDGELINEIMALSGAHYDYRNALNFYETVLTPTTGIDGFHYIWGNKDGSGVQNDIYLAFSSEQIKSADPVTYDDNGEVIPLSERFNAENDDIRYSYTPSKSEQVDELFDMYENGQISKDEFKRRVAGKKESDDPISLINRTPESMNTTPELQRKEGENKGDGERRTYDSYQASSIFSQTFKDEVKTDTFIKRYATITNEGTLLKAANELDEGGEAKVKAWFALESDRASVVDIAMGIILMDRYQRVGDTESQVAVAEKLSTMGTASGRAVQIFSILRRFDPAAMLLYAQKSMDKAYAHLVETKSKAWLDKHADDLRLTEEDIDFIYNRTVVASGMPDGRSKDIMIAQIAQRLQDKLPPEKGQSARALQRISMLLNPKTIGRNVLGNVVITPVHWVSDWIGTPLDKMLSVASKVRTKSGIADFKENAKAFGRGFIESYEDLVNKVNTQANLDRFEISQAGAKSFYEGGKLKSLAKMMNAMDRFTSFTLAAGDRPFYEYWFVRSINSQMKANKVDMPTEEMVAIATQEALERTWQDTNMATKVASGMKRVLNIVSLDNLIAGKETGGYGLGDVLIKFTKTPANLTKAIFDFSPAGFATASRDAVRFVKAVKSGKDVAMAQRNFVKSFSNAAAGTMLYVIAFALYNAGRLVGSSDEDKDVAAFEKWVQGIPAYSVKGFNGKWYSYEWMQPVGSIAAIVSDYMQNKESDMSALASITEAFKTGGTILYNQSFLQSFQKLFTADNIWEGLLESLYSDPSAFVPQVMSQTASLLDDKRRVTFDKTNPLKSALNSIMYKIPGLRNQLQEDVDVFGRPVPNSQNNVFDAFLNPANTYTDTSDEVTNHVYALYEELGSKAMIPAKAPYSITVGDKKIDLTPEQRAEYQTIMGTVAYKIIDRLLDSELYNSYTSAEKEIIIKDVYAYANKVALGNYDAEYTFDMARKDNKYITRAEYDQMSSEEKHEAYRRGVLSGYGDILDTNEDGVIAYYENRAVKTAVTDALEYYDVDKAKELIEIAESNIPKYSSDPEETTKRMMSEIKSNVTKIWKYQYQIAYYENDTERMNQIRQMLVDLGIYGKSSDVRKTLNEWLEESEKAKE